MALIKLERPINQRIHIEQPIVNTFAWGAFTLDREDRKYFGITRELTVSPKKHKDKKGKKG
jgi:hypothetical protein